ncbi:SRPBCC domain-containing protein [Flavihumibacter profundi]|uniref:SRPBCC domain-containing protein n=1 Tax=Flavihumibacter profundi TaxID=2716883 RepID=UPI001CC55E0A|nr:SRPBCC domain-containing protein [Flavihumibacter profundi]MBZ5856592.1 SRPBCC domain-containing protein [Flavihumibacter profundi]
MEIKIFDTYNELSRLAANDWLQLLAPVKNPLVCVASGDSPAGLYKSLVQLSGDGKWDAGKYNFLGLDEWLGMNGQDEGSCRYHLDQQFFFPLQVAAGKISFFDCRSADLQAECKKAEDCIANNGGLDLVILGLGLNGHVGMNEPGTDVASRSHIAELDPQSVQVGQKYFTRPQELTGGLTLGLATILEARYIFLIVSGLHKAGIVKELLEGPVSNSLPGSLLRNHPGATIYLDKESASLLSEKTLAHYRVNMSDNTAAHETGGSFDILSTRIFAVPRERLFRAWTDPVQLARWWGPKGFTNTFREFNCIPGGNWIFTMHGPNGVDYPNHSRFISIEEPVQIILDHINAPKFRLAASFEDLGGHTRLNFRMIFDDKVVRDAVKVYAVDANEQNFDRLQVVLDQVDG